jgi:hypothetical protein
LAPWLCLRRYPWKLLFASSCLQVCRKSLQFVQSDYRQAERTLSVLLLLKGKMGLDWREGGGAVLQTEVLPRHPGVAET